MTNRELLNNIYDTIKGTALKRDQSKDNDWEKMSRAFEKQARKDLGKWIKNKELELDFTAETITIGKHIKLKLERV